MKVRNGFVSNSSSSSFLLFLKEKPADEQAMKELLFSERKCGCYHDPYGDECWPTCTVAGIVWNDLQGAKPLTRDELIYELTSLSHYDYKDFPKAEEYDYKTTSEEQRRAIWAKHDKEVNEYCAKMADKLLEEHKGCQIFLVSYSDNDGQLSAAMEHGTLFEKVPHVRISHH